LEAATMPRPFHTGLVAGLLALTLAGAACGSGWVGLRQLGQERRGRERLDGERVGRLHGRVADLRHDVLHQLTHWAATHLAEITIEDLNVAGMLANRRLARRLSDAALAELHRQLTYKARWYGTLLHQAEPLVPQATARAKGTRCSQEIGYRP
jgi:IS605 OrfB family transposase